MTKQSVQYLVDDLERGGYLERRPDPDDRRAKLIAPTDRGVRTVHVAARGIEETVADWRAALGPEQFDRLVGLLRRLHATATGQEPALSAHAAES